MASLTIRDLRLHWARAEKALADGDEIIITRNSRPVARLVPVAAGPRQGRRRFDPVAHARRIQRFWRHRPAQPSTEVLLAQDRDE